MQEQIHERMTHHTHMHGGYHRRSLTSCAHKVTVTTVTSLWPLHRAKDQAGAKNNVLWCSFQWILGFR